MPKLFEICGVLKKPARPRTSVCDYDYYDCYHYLFIIAINMILVISIITMGVLFMNIPYIDITIVIGMVITNAWSHAPLLHK